MDINPTDDHVLIERKAEEQKENELIIPTRDLKPNRGVVLKVGEKCSVIKEGDIVVFGKFVGEEIVIDQKHLLILREFEIAGKEIQ